jgi:outer membrane protein insertion porin family
MAGISRLLVLLIAGCLAIARTAGAGEPVVSSVSFRSSSPYQLSYEELAGLVTLKPGMALSPEAVRESIRRLNGKAVFREVNAFVREDGGKAEVLFHLRPVPVISSIEVSGQKALTAARIIAATRLRKGAPLPEKDVDGARQAVESFLARKGFTGGKAAVEVSCSVSNGSGRVRIRVEEGAPAGVARFDVPGATVFPRERIEKILGAETGAPFDYEKWESGIPRLREEYRKGGYLTVHVEESTSPCGEGGGMCLRLSVDEGKRYEVRWKGNSRFSAERLAKVAGLHEGEETTEWALVYDMEERLRAFYLKEGYLQAQVDVAVGEEAAGAVPLEVDIREGQPGFIRRIRFEGNPSIPEKTLLLQMTTRRRGTFHRITGSGKYDEEEWDQDLKAVVGYYQSLGYVRMRVAGVDNQWDAGGGVTKTVRVEEGSRYRLRKVVFEGNASFPREELLSVMQNREGRFVDYVGLERDQEAVSAKYRNAGFLDSVVEGTLDFREDSAEAEARFRIDEGVRYRLGSVIVRGNILTRASAVLRENPIAPGGYAGEEQILRFQQAVYATGLYKSVRMQRVKRPPEGMVDLVIDVEEAMYLDVEFGAGYGSETGVRGSVYAKEKNIDGLGRSISALVMIGEKEQNYQAELREPYVLGDRWKWEGVLTASHLFQERPSFSLRKAALIAAIQRKVLERSTLSLQYEFSIDETLDVDPGAVLSEEDKGRANLGIARAVMVLDFRDDPFTPKRGTFLSGTAELGSGGLGSQVDFWSLAGQASFYTPVVRRTSLALSGRAGVIRPYGATSEVPIQKRFFAGGRTTVRGFEQDALGPKGVDGSATGGNYQLVLNAEMRFPLERGFLFAAFADAGSVWLSGDPANDFDLRESAGLSLRYVTPVGPISVDYGWKLDRRPGESPGEVSFTVGMVF